MHQTNEKKIETTIVFNDKELVKPRIEISYIFEKDLKAAFEKLHSLKAEYDRLYRNAEREKDGNFYENEWEKYHKENIEEMEELENLLKKHHRCVRCFKHEEGLAGNCDTCTEEMYEEYLDEQLDWYLSL